jgi:hypothetical protein
MSGTVKYVNHDERGAITQIIERTLSPEEEFVIQAWPRWRARLMEAEIFAVPEIHCSVTLSPDLSFDAVVHQFCEQVVADGFQGAQWKTMTFEEVRPPAPQHAEKNAAPYAHKIRQAAAQSAEQTIDVVERLVAPRSGRTA